MILLDTHVWWWALNEPEQLSKTATETILATPRDRIRISAISLWEFSRLIHQKRVTLSVPPEAWLRRALDESGIQVHPLSPEVALEAYRLPEPFHRDPADRIITATARILGAQLVTKDRLLRQYPHVAAIWD